MILIIAAMDEELNALKNLGNNIKEKKIYDIKTIHMDLAGHSVVLSLSGVGKVNAAFTTSILSNIYDPDLVINIGSAGGLLKNQKVGDIVIATKVRTHDVYIGPDTYNDERFISYPNLNLAKLGEKVALDLDLNTHLGEIVSGDQFITHGGKDLARIEKRFPKAICVEMEAGAIGGVCKRLNIPFIVLRSLSDVPLNKDNHIEFDEFLPIASKNSAQITKSFLKQIN